MDILSQRQSILFLFVLAAIVLPTGRVSVADELPFERTSELQQIWRRLDELEQQNQELAAQNARLTRIVESNPTCGHPQDCDTPPPAEPCHSCCSCCGCGPCSCLCPQQPAPCLECPHVSTLQPYWNVNIFGALITDLLYSSQRPLGPGTPFFLLPESPFGFNNETFDIHARQTQLGAVFTGPRICGLQAGGLALITLYNDALIVDRYGVLPLQAYGELRSDVARFSAGLQFDVFAPNAANVLPFSILSASGNGGNNFRGQVRVERYMRTSNMSQWTFQAAISEPIATGINNFVLIEDNGWPNLEGRVMYGLGPAEQVGLEQRRALEVGVSAVVGEVRTTELATQSVADNVWGLGLDYRCKLNERWGVQGELIHGQGLGTYNAGIFQTVNPQFFNAVESTGGWMEVWYYWTPCVHSHFGYGVDNPRDGDLIVTNNAVTRLRNETWFANWLWDVTPSFRIGVELAYRETKYFNALDADGGSIHTQFRWNF